MYDWERIEYETLQKHLKSRYNHLSKASEMCIRRLYLYM